MTEDMRERFEKAREDFAAAYNDMHSRCVARAAFMAGWQEAALSSAGTSGTVRCSFCHKEPNQVEFVISTPNDYARAFICSECVAVCNSVLDEKRGDSLSGKGEATKEVMPNEAGRLPAHNAVVVEGEHRASSEASASAPDRAEELAREIIALQMKCDAYKPPSPCPKCVEAVASLLRREMAVAPPREGGNVHPTK